MLRVAMGAGIGLGIDESYMVVAGRGPLQFGYFDHPLVSWWLARGIADFTGSESALVVRLPFIGLFAVSTWLMAKLGAAISTPRGGLWAAIAFNLAPVFGVSTGGWVLPDGPLVCALLGMALCLVRALPGRGWGLWMGAGACAGLAMLSKYTAVLDIAGLALYLLVDQEHRAWLTRPQPYAAALLALAVFSPTIFWNVQSDWASLAFQGGRAAAARFRQFGPIVTFAGEALFLLPWIWAGLVFAFWRGMRERHSRLLCLLAAPSILLFALVSFWSRQVLFHWASPGYLMLFPLLGAWLAERAWAPRAAMATAALLGVGSLLAVGEIRLDWIPLGGDSLLQAQDWSALRPALAPLGLPIAGTSWSDTGKIGIGMGPDIAVFCLNPDAREFRFTTTPPSSGDVVIVAPHRSLAQIRSSYGGTFTQIDPLTPVRVGASELDVFVGRGVKQWPR